MTARRGLRADEDMQLRLELEEEKRAEEDYEEMLKQEAERLSVRDFQPQVCVNLVLFCLLSSIPSCTVKVVVIVGYARDCCSSIMQ